MKKVFLAIAAVAVMMMTTMCGCPRQQDQPAQEPEVAVEVAIDSVETPAPVDTLVVE